MPASYSSTRKNIMVGLDDVLIDIMDKLTDGQLDRRIIPIVGMGGSGKTTLSKNVYRNQVVVQRFDILVWVTISQQYRVKDLLLELLPEEGRQYLIELSESELGERVHKRLSGRRYLIVLDDIWDIQAWDQLRRFFPNKNNGSRIMLTTRLSNLAYQVASSNVIKMNLLDEDNSRDLFSKTAFGEEGCPFELEEIGKKIVKNCKGLPLSIVVVGGLLAKTEHKQEYWERIGGNLSSAVNSEDNESCLKILHMSYTELQVYLKPCFLYMGVFQEDSEIRVSALVKLWVAEGFLKPIRGKSMKIVAKEYLKELVDRNLVLVQQLGSTGSMKYCKIHDLLRDLCLREAQKERFYYNVTRQDSTLPGSVNSRRRIVAFDSISDEKVMALKSGSPIRSLIWDNNETLPSFHFRLLRILKAKKMPIFNRENKFKFVSSRYISVPAYLDYDSFTPFYHIWNLQTLVLYSMSYLTAPSEIWNMPQLKHIECKAGLFLPGPPSSLNGGKADVMFANLQGLMSVINFKCGEETVKRIINVEKLELHYMFLQDDLSQYCLNNLQRLHKLESLFCKFGSSVGRYDSLQKLTFPHSLKKLHLSIELYQDWEDIMEKIGSLPLLEKLRLKGGSFCGNRWETVEGQFRSLKFLEIVGFGKLEYWTTDSTHFPRLRRLVLKKLSCLREISSDIGAITSLQSMEVKWCSDSAVICAKEIARVQEELGNEDLKVRVTLDPGTNIGPFMSLETTPNFQVEEDEEYY